MKKFFTSNDPLYRLLRTIVQGVIGVVVANIDVIIGGFVFDITTRTIIVGIVMAILSPIMALLGKEENDDSNNK